MPHTASAKKRMRQSAKRRMHNRAVQKDMKLQLKVVGSAAEKSDTGKLDEAVREAIKIIDKAAAKRVIHPNNASRKKSQLARMLYSKKKAAGAVK